MDTRVNHRGPSGEIAAARYNERVDEQRADSNSRRCNFLFVCASVLLILVMASHMLGCQGARIDGTPWGQVELLGADPVANPCDTCTPAR